jgi:hypothetical protein
MLLLHKSCSYSLNVVTQKHTTSPLDFRGISSVLQSYRQRLHGSNLTILKPAGRGVRERLRHKHLSLPERNSVFLFVKTVRIIKVHLL